MQQLIILFLIVGIISMFSGNSSSADSDGVTVLKIPPAPLTKKRAEPKVKIKPSPKKKKKLKDDSIIYGCSLDVLSSDDLA